MFKIQTLNSINPAGLNQFPKELYEVGPEIKQPDAILLRSYNLHEMPLHHSLKVVGRAGTGVNNIPIKALTERGIPVLNTPGANANAVRELVIAGMLLASRNICQAWNYVMQLKNNDIEKQIEQDKKLFLGFELKGKTLAIIGLGSVGVKVANAAIHLGMQVIGYDPTITVDRAWELSADVKQAGTLEQVLKYADFVTLHVPLTEGTQNMIDSTQLQQMKDNVVILNFSREGIVHNQALHRALQNKKIGAYVTDFPNPSLKNYTQVISLPHLGASTREAEENCAVMIAKEIRDFFERGTIMYSANFPSLEMPLSKEGVRLAISNLNIPNMVAQISSKLAQAKLNILSLMNKSRDDIAYTLIDVGGVVNEPLLKEIASIQGVMQVRIITHALESLNDRLPK